MSSFKYKYNPLKDEDVFVLFSDHLQSPIQ